VFEQKDHNVFVVTKNIVSTTEIGVQFRRSNVTVHAQNDGILRINFKKKKTSGKKSKTAIIYTALRNVSSKANPQCSTHENFVTFVKDKFYTFIQLDKPVYAPGHTVKMAILQALSNFRLAKFCCFKIRDISKNNSRNVQQFFLLNQ
jgi:hypothetical protein